jgi:hypothetical protein
MTRTRLELLASPPLMAALAVLALNDRVLKPALHNALTGKLSDVAGVAAFALFWAALFPRRRPYAFVMTAVGFCLWKSPASQGAIDAWNSVGWWTIGRVVDWTDLLALAVLPVIYRYDARPVAIPRLRRVVGPAVAAACVLAFGATSRVQPSVDLVNAAYAFDLPPDSLLMRMYELRTGFFDLTVPPAGARKHGPDTLQLVVGVRRGDGTLEMAFVEAALAATAGGGSVLRPYQASGYGVGAAAEALRALEEQVVEPVRRNRPNTVHLALPPVGNRPLMAPRILSPGELFLPRAQVRVAIAEPAFLALVEVTPRLDWQVIYPVDEADVRRFPAGEHTLATLCARTAASAPVPPGDEVPPCALARRMTLEDAGRLEGRVPDPCPDPYQYPVPRVLPGTLLLIAADRPMPRAALEASIGGWCQAHPRAMDQALNRVLRGMGVHHWAAADHPLRR